jgi:hypothetical protein
MGEGGNRVFILEGLTDDDLGRGGGFGIVDDVSRIALRRQEYERVQPLRSDGG